MFTFLSPLFLIGMLAAGIPLIIHLSRSRRMNKMRFSTTRFFTDQFLRSYRMSRLKELLLLIARMALFALLAMALAQPIFMPKGHALSTGKRSIVIVLDNSASMDYVEDGVRMFDKAKVAAGDVLSSLRPGDAAAVVLAARRGTGPEALFPEPTTSLKDVEKAINALTVASLGTDLQAAVDQAETIVRKGAAQSREVYVLSDLQDSGWEIRQRQAKADAESGVMFFFVRLRPKTPEDVSITAVQYAAARPMIGIPFSIRPHVFNQGSEVRSTEVTLYVDGQKVGQQGLEKLQPGRWVVPLFHHTFTAGGWHSGWLEVQDANFPPDNRRYFAFEVMDSIRILAVDGAPSQVAALDELFFLKTALTVNPEGKGAIQLDVVKPSEFGQKDLAAYPLVILANVESLAPAALEKLEEYVDRGGSLFVFLGNRVNATFYNQSLSSPTRLHGGLLPARLVGVVGNPAGEADYATISGVNYENAALAAFQDPKFASLAGVGFKALWKVDPGDSMVLMSVSTGDALLCEKAFGKGRVFLFTSSCDRDWGSFPVRPVYLPWAQRCVSYLAQQPMGRSAFYTTGQRVPVPVSATEGMPRVLVRKPDSSIGRATIGDDPKVPLEFTDTAQPGVYAFYSSDQNNQPAARPAQLFVANLESYESDLRYLDDVLEGRPGAKRLASRQARVEQGFKELLPGRPLVVYVDKPGEVVDVSSGARRGLKLWDVILAVVLLIALLEPWVANRISLRHYIRAASVEPAPAIAARRRTAAQPRAEQAGVGVAP